MDRERTRSYADPARPGAVRLVVFWDGGYVARDLRPGARVVIGRAESAELRVAHDSVSRAHLAICATPDGVEARDLGSFNGTRRGEDRLPANEPVPIAPGELLRFGAATLVVQGPSVAPGEAAAAPLKTTDGATLELVAKSPIAVLLLGETGAGKEIAAERIHALSPRARGPLVKINCAALPEPLLESELFGHEKGAFTGAAQAKLGLLESAHGGTLLLDEIGEMPLVTQAKLLRVLENGEVMRLGSLRPRAIDVRLVSATNRDVDEMLASRAFREDLYFRVAGVTLVVPPLRERRGEIRGMALELAAAACTKLGRGKVRFTERAITLLERHAWPGNVRELRNVVDRAVLLCRGDEVDAEHLALAPRRASEPVPTATEGLKDELDALERKRIVDALEKTGGNQSKTAALLRMSRRALVRRLEEYGLPRPRKG
jgi:transcriptional regulator with GAF, ATPase, and Fis domain